MFSNITQSNRISDYKWNQRHIRLNISDFFNVKNDKQTQEILKKESSTSHKKLSVLLEMKHWFNPAT